ncbi:MAG: ExbD/TolR family protein [Desulfovibrionaceae bacterium]
MQTSDSDNDSSFIAEINITPLVDVLLVLLVILIVSAPYVTEEGIELSLPQTKAVETLPIKFKGVTVSVSKTNGIFVQGKQTTLEKLRLTLETLQKSGNISLFLEADKSVSYDIVLKVIGEIQQAGISEIGMIASPE